MWGIQRRKSFSFSNDAWLTLHISTPAKTHWFQQFRRSHLLHQPPIVRPYCLCLSSWKLPLFAVSHWMKQEHSRKISRLLPEVDFGTSSIHSYVVIVELLETPSQAVSGKRNHSDKSIEPRTFHELVSSWSFVGIYSQHSSDHFFSFLRNIPEPFLFEPKEN